jgi:D,D-heptose 1,7-bisphosphate phosphatase
MGLLREMFTMNALKKAIFIDKDGTLIPDIPYNVDPDLIVLEKCVGEGLRLLQGEGYELIIISNQSGVALGRFKESRLDAVRERIALLLRCEGIQLSGFYYCPHHPQGIIKKYAINCNCRKPGQGMLLAAAKDLGIDLAASWMIGDILNDVEAGNKAGCRTILIDNGNETEWDLGAGRRPYFVAQDIRQAANQILREVLQISVQ